MSETSLHHCVPDIATLLNKVELYLFSPQRLNYFCAEKIYLHYYNTSGHWRPH